MTDEMSAAEFNASQKKQGKQKYHAEPIVIDGIRFHSKAESIRYWELKQRERAGEIIQLTLQPKYPLEVNGMKICTYVADFRYRDPATGEVTIEDVKGMLTPVYRLKKRLMKAVHGIDITEVAA